MFNFYPFTFNLCRQHKFESCFLKQLNNLCLFRVFNLFIFNFWYGLVCFSDLFSIAQALLCRLLLLSFHSTIYRYISHLFQHRHPNSLKHYVALILCHCILHSWHFILPNSYHLQLNWYMKILTFHFTLLSSHFAIPTFLFSLSTFPFQFLNYKCNKHTV